MDSTRLLRPTETSTVDGLRENVSLNSLQDVRTSLERVAGRCHLNSSVERIQLKHVMMQGPAGLRAGASVDGSRHADLLASISKFLTLGNAFWKTCGSRGDIPDDPMHLIVGGAIASEVEVVHVQHERLRAVRRVGPCHRRRSAFPWCGARRSLTELHGDDSAVGKARNGQRHRWCGPLLCLRCAGTAARNR